MILVAGAGAIGGLLAARLGDATMLARASTVEAVRRAGLRVEGLTDVVSHPHAVASTQGLGGFDAIFLTVKAHQTRALAAELAPLLAEHGVMVSLQNGFGNAQAVADAVGADRTGVALTSHGVTVLAPGHLHHAGTGPTRIGAMPGASPEAARHGMAVLERAGFEPVWEDDIRAAVWLKALVNHGLNPVAALAACTNGDVLDDQERLSTALALVDEGIALSRAAGIALPGDPKEALRGTLERTRGNQCSMVQDVLAKRPTEIDQITGFLVRLARRLGYPLFRSEEMYHAVKELEESYLADAWASTKAQAEHEERWATW